MAVKGKSIGNLNPVGLTPRDLLQPGLVLDRDVTPGNRYPAFLAEFGQEPAQHFGGSAQYLGQVTPALGELDIRRALGLGLFVDILGQAAPYGLKAEVQELFLGVAQSRLASTLADFAVASGLLGSQTAFNEGVMTRTATEANGEFEVG